MINWRKIIIPLALNLNNSKVYKNYQEILLVSQMSHTKIMKYQQNRLKDLLLYSYKYVPYYNKILKKHKVVVNNNINLDKFKTLPILTKDIIKNNFNDLKSTIYESRKPYRNTSGGSTGEPVIFIQDKFYNDWNIANKIFYCGIYGKNIGEKEIKLWGSDKDILENTIGYKNKLKYWLYNRKFINTFNFTDREIKETINIINSFKPKLLWGYVNSLYALSNYIRKNSSNIYPPSIIFSSAGNLYPNVKKAIQSAFPLSKIVNVYGSRDMGDMAISDIDGKGLITFDHTHFIETITYKKGQYKKIIATSLTNLSMPMIRYDIGDLSSGFMQNFGSQYKYNKLLNIIGRETELIKKPGGGYIPPEFFIHMIGVYYNSGEIKQFQIIQRNIESLDINIVSDSLNKKTIHNINNIIYKVMGNIHIKYNRLKSIPNLPNGKYVYIKSFVKV